MARSVKATVKTPIRKTSNILVNAWGTAQRPGSLLLTAKGECMRIATDMAKEMRDSLYSGRFKMAPLSPKYLEWKVKKKLDTRILIAYKKYVENIQAIPTPYGARIGMKQLNRIVGRGKKKRIIPYALLQKWLEYGTMKKVSFLGAKVSYRMPPRPHWRPMIAVWKQNRRAYSLRIKNVVGVKLKEQLAGSK